MKKDPTSRELSDSARRATVYRPPATDTYRTADGQVDIRRLASALKRDRLALRMTWPKYSDHMGVPLATLYKIARGDSKHPHELTVQTITDKWEVDSNSGSAARAGDVVPT